jgi:hypothetical protein
MLTKFELREGRIPMCNSLHPCWLVRFTIERFALSCTLTELCEVFLLLSYILGPSPESDLIEVHSVVSVMNILTELTA